MVNDDELEAVVWTKDRIFVTLLCVFGFIAYLAACTWLAKLVTS